MKLPVLRSMGIDPSTKSTGIVVLESTMTPIPKTVLATSLGHMDFKGIRRYRELAKSVILTYHTYKPDVVVIEGYSLNTAHASSLVPLVELGAIIRLMFNLDGIQWFDPRASQVKQFVTGKGNSAKDKMMMCVLKNWGFESENNDIADAYGCAAMGLACRNRLPGVDLAQRSVVGKLVIRSE